MMNRREVLAAATTLRLARAQDRKPNLLFIIADDHAGYVLGAQGNRRAVTPHLDRLAAEGTRFARHYCNSPVCTPSRQSILTGRLPHSSGVTVLRTPLDESKPTLADKFSERGYATAVFGKMHFNRPGVPGLHGFQTAWTEDVVQKKWTAAVGPVPSFDSVKTKPVWRPFKDPARIWLNAEKLPFPREYAQMKSTWTAQQACRFLQEHKDSPFALWVSFQEPHSPFDFPVEDRDKFKPAAFPVPDAGPEDAAQIPLIFRDLSPAEKQGIIAAYYTSVNYLDRNVGVVLDRLKSLKLDRDTLVVYMADHGYSLGQHGRFEKHCCYDPALQVPLIMRWPGQVARTVVQEFTESIDVPATITDLLGLEPFSVAHGQSLKPYLKAERPARPRQSIFSEYLENEEACIRTHECKLIHCSGRRRRTDGYETDQPTPGRTVRLFDLKTDPGEFRNLAEREPEVVRLLSEELIARFRSSHPDAPSEPGNLKPADAIEWYLRPRDAVTSA